MIHVCYGLYDKNGHYSKFTGTSILSMFENVHASNSVIVHILHDNTLTKDNRDKFLYLAEKYNQCITFYNVEELCAESIKQLQTLFAKHEALKVLTVGATFRLLVAKILPSEISKIIYLDSDTIINLDINELWQIPLEDKPLAAMTEIEQVKNAKDFFILCKAGIIKPEEYFNSGVMIMNLEKLRGSEYENLQKGIKFISENPKYNCFLDQDILNYSFSRNYLKLPVKFNSFIRPKREFKNFNTKNCILHYAGNVLNLDRKDIFNRLWFDYFEKTPWGNKDSIDNIHNGYRKFFMDFHAKHKKFAILSTTLVAGKKRAFFFFVENVETAKKAFSVQEEEEIISNINEEEPFQKLVDSMADTDEKKVFFILFKDYHTLRQLLIEAGFVEGQDFINAEIFLPSADELDFDTKVLLSIL